MSRAPAHTTLLALALAAFATACGAEAPTPAAAPGAASTSPDRGLAQAPIAASAVAGDVSVQLSSSPRPSTLGVPVVLRVEVWELAPTPGRPSGTVTFFDGATEIGTGTLDNAATTTLTLEGLSVGTHTFTASYSGDDRFVAAQSVPLSHVVDRAATVTAAVVSPTSAVVGQPVTVDVTVTSLAGTPAGTVQFTDGFLISLGTATLDAAGTATFTTSALAVGRHPLRARFLGAGDFLLSVSSALNVTVAKAPTAVALSTSPAAPVSGEPVTVLAQVSVPPPGAGAPTGTVTFHDGATLLGTAAVDAATGLAAIALPAPATGRHDLTAAYGGDNGFLPSAAPATLALEVARADVAVSLSATPTPSTFGEPVTLSVSVAPVAPGAGVPTGTITLEDGAGFSASLPLADGAATVTTAALPAGPHAFTARYAGDGAFAPGEAALAHQVAPASTTTALSAAPAPTRFGEPVTLVAAVAVGAPGAGLPAGAVTFLDGSTVLGTAPLQGGVATLAVADLHAGVHALAAEYAGDAGFAASAGAASHEVLPAATATAFSAAPLPARSGQAVTLSATVTTLAPGAGVPDGLVTFRDGAEVLGTAALAGGQASLTTSALAAGDHALAVEYAGTADFAPSGDGAAARVDQGSTSVAVQTSRPASRRGRPVTFTATVGVIAPATGVPTGAVAFKAGEALLATVDLVDGAASFTTRALPKGTHPITAEYAGAAAFEPGVGTLEGGQVVENSPPVAGAGTALVLGAGAASQATLGLSGALDAGALTVEAWVKAGWTEAALAGADPRVLTLGAGPRLAVGLAPDRAAVTVASGGWSRSVPASLDEGWHHLAVVAAGDAVLVYVDGALAGTIEGALDGAGGDLVLGGGFAGELDEVRAWSVARTQDELAEARRRPLGGDEPGLAGLWRFDEAEGAELFDAGPGLHDGTLEVAADGLAFVPSQAWRRREVRQEGEMAPAHAGYDADGDPLTLAVVTPATGGTAWADAEALELRYQPAGGYLGADAVTYSLDDGSAASTYELELQVSRAVTCHATADCGGGDVCVQSQCLAPTAPSAGSAGGMGCTTAAGAPAGLWALLPLALLRRRRRASRAP